MWIRCRNSAIYPKKGRESVKLQALRAPKNAGIQLLRVIACLMVFAVHLGQRLELSGTLRTVTDFGKNGVFLFFIISGFLAASSLCLREQVSKKEYYIKRAIAILPLYYIIILLVFAVEQTVNHFAPCIPEDVTGLRWLRFVFLLNGAVNSPSLYWSNLAGTWAIPVFTFFYLIAPWILPKIKTAKGAFCIWAIIFLLAKGLGLVYTCYISANLHFFFLGVFVFFCHREKAEQPALVLLLLLAVGSQILSQGGLSYSFLLACLLLVLYGMSLSLPKAIGNVVNVLDQYSFTLYLAHEALFHCAVDRMRDHGVHWTAVAAVAIGGTVAVTWVIGRFIEHPLQEWLRGKLLGKH